MPPPPPAQVRGYRSLLSEKRSELGDKCNKLKGGLEKLAETTEQVGDAGRGGCRARDVCAYSLGRRRTGDVCLQPWYTQNRGCVCTYPWRMQNKECLPTGLCTCTLGVSTRAGRQRWSWALDLMHATRLAHIPPAKSPDYPYLAQCPRPMPLTLPPSMPPQLPPSLRPPPCPLNRPPPSPQPPCPLNCPPTSPPPLGCGHEEGC